MTSATSSAGSPSKASEAPVFQPWRAVVASFAIGSAGLLLSAVYPLLFGQYVEAGTLSSASMGRLAALEMGTLALATIVLPNIISRDSMRIRVLASICVLVVANTVSAFATSEGVLYVLRALCGICEGCLLGASVAVQIGTRRPDRTNALFLAANALPVAVCGYAIPAVIIPRWGLHGGFILVSAILLAPALFTGLLPNKVQWRQADPIEDAPDQKRRGRLARWAILMVIAAVLLENIGITAPFSYFEQIARLRDIGGRNIGLAFGLGALAYVVGGLFTAWILTRVTALWILLAALASFIVATVAIALFRDTTVYISGLLAFNFLWGVALPPYVGVAVDIDPSRRAALRLSGISLFGASLGPALGSLFVDGGDLLPVFWFGASAMFVAIVLFLLAYLMAARLPRRP